MQNDLGLMRSYVISIDSLSHLPTYDLLFIFHIYKYFKIWFFLLMAIYWKYCWDSEIFRHNWQLYNMRYIHYIHVSLTQLIKNNVFCPSNAFLFLELPGHLNVVKTYLQNIFLFHFWIFSIFFVNFLNAQLDVSLNATWVHINQINNNVSQPLAFREHSLSNTYII